MEEPKKEEQPQEEPKPFVPPMETPKEESKRELAPISEGEPVPEQPFVEPQPGVVSQEIPALIRCNDDKVYLLEKRWVKNLETLQKLGFELTDVQSVTPENFMKFREGESLNLDSVDSTTEGQPNQPLY